MSNASKPNTASPRYSAPVVFLLSAVWIAFCFWASGLLARLLPTAGDWVNAMLTALFLFAGLYSIARRFVPSLRPLSGVGFVRRPTAGAELALGLSLGWAAAILLVLPCALSGNLHIAFLASHDTWRDTLLGLLTISFTALAVQLVLTGLAFRALVDSVGATSATVLTVLLTSLWSMRTAAGSTWAAILLGVCALLSCVAWLRTRAIWLPIGLQLSLGVGLGLIFGLPLPGGQRVSGVVTGSVTGPAWLSGEDLGPIASVVALMVLLGMLIALIRLTREYAWHYTFEPIVSAGYPMDVAPPAEHTRMEEEAAAKPVPLVQILPVAADAPVKDNL